ncbi:transmembrane protein, putative (macronuclear) [Tetrahymena thermophila SB210]|uniref:Transmembrane protein, putative n=1 Tax=Tetrahymena thermophila (strain SB210) TaxID=312017 RepID=W7XFS1_TETTS|nr:transmembrane protein, putative [Tetrahymena thermophila SB210]EWS71669.1 transmembrane protein, putative [Tetrahymena thermophila SB210]|eukprot:XP_012655780.1 transmembrane protein, putative [Tetrahymena thermophila SB210]
MDLVTVLMSVLLVISLQQNKEMSITRNVYNVLITAFLAQMNPVALNAIIILKNTNAIINYFVNAKVKNVNYNQDHNCIFFKMNVVRQKIALSVNKILTFAKNAIRNILIFIQTHAQRVVQKELIQTKIMNANNVILCVQIALVNHQMIVQAVLYQGIWLNQIINVDVLIKKFSFKIDATVIVQDLQKFKKTMIEFANNTVLIIILSQFLMMMESLRDVRVISMAKILNIVNKI